MDVQRTSPGDGATQTACALAVEVRSGFDGTWCAGFELVEIVCMPTEVGYRLRRAGGTVLPKVFGAEEVRLANLAASATLAHIPVSFVE